MNTSYKLFGLVLFLATVVVGIMIFNSAEPEYLLESSPSLRRSHERPPTTATERPDDRFGQGSRPVSWSIDRSEWSIEDLELYLDTQKIKRTDSSMSDLIKVIMPPPLGSKTKNNTLLPGSISVSDQTRIVLKYVEPTLQAGVLQFLWAKNQGGSEFDKYLGEVVSQLGHGHARYEFIRRHMFHYFSDFERMSHLFESKNPIGDPFQNFTAEPGDETAIINGLNPAFIILIQKQEMTKTDVIEMIINSSADKTLQTKMIDYINTWAR